MMPVWGVQSLQAVWWGAKPPTLSVGDIYQAVIGAAPASVQANPAGGIGNAVGIQGSSVLRLQVQASRVDLFENPQPQAGPAFSLFSDFQLAMQRFRQRLAPTSNIVGDAVRLAVVVNTSEESRTGDEATNLLLSKLGFSLPFQGGDELIFQINRRRPLAAMAGHELNRIMKWLVENVQQFTLSTGSPVVHSVFLSTLSVDVNTVPTVRTFTPAEQLPIFQEIGDEAERLCRANALTALS
jgi:hypothetical protein